MATYTEIRDLFSDDAMRNKMDVAVIVAAEALLAGTPTLSDQKWAAAAFNSPRSESTKAFMAVLAANKTSTVATIQGASDAAIQTKVDAIVGSLVAAFNAV